MSQFEYVALAEKGIIESIFGIQPNADGTFTFTAIQKYPRTNYYMVIYCLLTFLIFKWMK